MLGESLPSGPARREASARCHYARPGWKPRSALGSCTCRIFRSNCISILSTLPHPLRGRAGCFPIEVGSCFQKAGISRIARGCGSPRHGMHSLDISSFPLVPLNMVRQFRRLGATAEEARNQHPAESLREGFYRMTIYSPLLFSKERADE